MLVPGSIAGTHSLRCNTKEQRSLLHRMTHIYIMTYKLHSTRLALHQSFSTNKHIAWSPSSSCATGEHVEDRLVTLIIVTHSSIKYLQQVKLQPKTFGQYFECIGKMSLFSGHKWRLIPTCIFGWWSLGSLQKSGHFAYLL